MNDKTYCTICGELNPCGNDLCEKLSKIIAESFEQSRLLDRANTVAMEARREILKRKFHNKTDGELEDEKFDICERICEIADVIRSTAGKSAFEKLFEVNRDRLALQHRYDMINEELNFRHNQLH
jgi:hypothetical protein